MRPDYLLREAKKMSAAAWDRYSDCIATDSCYRVEIEARDLYIKAHNNVTRICHEIKKRDRTIKKTISKTQTAGE